MKKILVPFLSLLMFLSAIFGLVAWLSAINPREVTFGWSVRIATAILFPTCLAALIWLLHQPEPVPDFFSSLRSQRMGRGGVLFSFEVIADRGWAWMVVHYQNRYSNPAKLVVAVKPSQNFLMSRNAIDPILVKFLCGPAGYGIVRIPLSLKLEYQGQKQLFDVAANIEYPIGTGEILRNVVGPEISKLDAHGFQETTEALARLAATGHFLGLKFQSRVKLSLPTGVQDNASDPPDIEQEEKWVLPTDFDLSTAWQIKRADRSSAALRSHSQ